MHGGWLFGAVWCCPARTPHMLSALLPCAYGTVALEKGRNLIFGHPDDRRMTDALKLREAVMKIIEFGFYLSARDSSGGYEVPHVAARGDECGLISLRLFFFFACLLNARLLRAFPNGLYTFRVRRNITR